MCVAFHKTSKMNMNGVLVILLVISVAYTSAQHCLTSEGVKFQIGQPLCTSLPRYSDYQWATCLTNSYVRGRGFSNITDPYDCTEYLWLPCQLDVNGLYQGPVDDNCRCSTDAPTLPPQLTLTYQCFSPTGIDCTWYQDCLERRQPCEDSDYPYAITYADTYCGYFMENYDFFSERGKMWVDGVRLCLQNALLPPIRPWNFWTCEDIRSHAFDSHPECYLNPGDGIPTICELPCKDVVTLLVRVDVLRTLFSDALFETVVQIWEVAKVCPFNGTGCTDTLTLSLSIPGYAAYKDAGTEINFKIGSYIADAFSLDSKGFGWFTFSNKDTNRRRRNADSSDTDDNSIFILLADLEALGISATSTGQQTLEDLAVEFARAAENGLLSNIPITINSTEVIFSVSSVGQCGDNDTFCSNTTNVKEIPGGSTSTGPGNGGIATFTVNLYVLFMMHIMLQCILTQFF